MNKNIETYNAQQNQTDAEICSLLAKTIDLVLAEADNKIWHAHPVWFIEGNPIVGYSKQKAGWRLMFWSGQDFNEEKLSVRGEKFKDASIFYTSPDQIDTEELKRWLEKSKMIQYDYKNIMKKKGQLDKLN